MTMELRAEIRGAGLFGRLAVQRARRLRVDERLYLARQPHNPSDHNAILVIDSRFGAVGYVERRVAAAVAPGMDRGETWLAAVLTPHSVVYHHGRARPTEPVARLWRP